jgi:small subunit ribosomal protein S11
MMGKINGQGMLNENYPGKGGPIEHLEVVLRDFGPGREAVTKILMGAEGKRVREKVLRVMDSTRLKFGGTRSKKPRRLG